jgi:hypothetical protein
MGDRFREISRKQGYKWKQRYESGGVEGWWINLGRRIRIRTRFRPTPCTYPESRFRRRARVGAMLRHTGVRWNGEPHCHFVERQRSPPTQSRFTLHVDSTAPSPFTHVGRLDAHALCSASQLVSREVASVTPTKNRSKKVQGVGAIANFERP